MIGSGAGPPTICVLLSRAPSRYVAKGSPEMVRSGLLVSRAVNDWSKLKLFVLLTKTGPTAAAIVEPRGQVV